VFKNLLSLMFILIFIPFSHISADNDAIGGLCINTVYEVKMEFINGLPVSVLGFADLNFHIIFHRDGTVSFTESALFPENDIIGERTAIGNWKRLANKELEFTLFQSIIDQTDTLLPGCADYACKNTALGKATFGDNCQTLQYSWNQTILDEDGLPVPSPLLLPGKNYFTNSGSGIESSINKVNEIFDDLGIPRP